MTIQELNDKVIVLTRSNDRIYLAPDLSFDGDILTNYLPGQLYRIIRYSVEYQTLYIKADGKAPENLFLRTAPDIASFLSQLPIREIQVKNTGLTGHLSTYQSTPVPTPPSPPSPPPPPPPPSPQPPPPPIPQYTPVRIRQTVKCDVRKATFEDGKVSFQTNLRGAMGTPTITIRNLRIKKYFDAIKPYIWKIYGSKLIDCEIEYSIEQLRPVNLEVGNCALKELSEDIVADLYDNWIEEVLINNPGEDIYPFDEIVNGANDDTITPDSVFNHLVKEEKTKHYHHLNYLSARQEASLEKLQITGKPMSFVFLIKDMGHYYLIWETYLSEEATYIWKLQARSSTDLYFEKREKYNLIMSLRKNQRRVYRSKKEPGFMPLDHEYKLEKNGFESWTQKLKNILNTL